MSIARNDVEYAVTMTEAAAKDPPPEFNYLTRIATGHLLEGIEAFERWSQDPDVARFLRALPEAGRAAREQVRDARNKIGSEALRNARNHTFHYPYPGPPAPPTQTRCSAR
jgi:hypothetical protein